MSRGLCNSHDTIQRSLLTMGILFSGIFELAGGGTVSVVSARPSLSLGSCGVHVSHTGFPPLAVIVLGNCY